MNKHTPGSWGRDADDDAPVQGMSRVFHSGTRQAVAWRIGNEADARLIAAAPDLLAALEELIDEWDRHGCCDSRAVVDRARNVVAQAKGDRP